jgi:hypothetical protein
MPTRFIECEPAGPLAGADCAGTRQVGRAWGRQFSRRIPDEGHGGYAMVRLAFFVEDTPVADDRPRRLLNRRTQYLIYRDPADPTGTSTYSSAVTHTLRPVGVLGAAEADDHARTTCARFRPDTIDWDGWPGSEKPCDPGIEVYANGSVAAYCRTHGAPLAANAEVSAPAALGKLVCDKGRGWWFLVDTADAADPAPPQLVDLTGAKRVVTAAIEGGFYGTDDAPVQVWRYRRPGQLVPLVLRRTPGDGDQRHLTDDDDRLPLIISQRWQLVDPDAGQVYLETSISLNGDA